MTERIKIEGREISEIEFAKHVSKIKNISEMLVNKGELTTLPTFFEQITAAALCAFADEKVELAVLETGLGGRFDATTAANAEIFVFTPIDYDHQQYLGDTLTKIATEKAAIIRADTKVITAAQSDEPLCVIKNRCAAFGVIPENGAGY